MHSDGNGKSPVEQAATLLAPNPRRSPLKVIAAIHWEALRLLAKGVRLQARPAAPARPVTLAKPADS